MFRFMILQQWVERDPPITQKPGRTVLPCWTCPPSSICEAPGGFIPARKGRVGQKEPLSVFLAFHSHFVLFSGSLIN